MLELFRSPRRAIVWFVEASLLSLLAVCAAGFLVGWAQALGHEHFLRALLVSVVAEISIYYHGLHDPRPLRPRALVLGFVRALSLAAAAVWLLFHLSPEAALGRVFAASLAGAAVVLPAFRAGYQRVAASERLRCPVVILGTSPLARECASLLSTGSELGLRLEGVLVPDADSAPGEGVLGGYPDLLRVCEERRVGLVLVAPADRRGTLPLDDLLELRFRGVGVEDGLAFHERVTGRMFVPALTASHLIFSDRSSAARRAALAVKRAFDVLAAAAGLLLGAPILALAAIAVRLDSPGPALYSQVRAGCFGKSFRMHKLRSMRVDAEARGAVWASENDPRVTRVGRFLRRTRIDELPQLWNVLAGDMSLVGPRPERPVFVEQLEREIPFFRQRLRMKPGVTGHAQVRCRYGASVEDAVQKLQYDLFYIKRFSLWFDLSILIDTVKVVLLRIGSR